MTDITAPLTELRAAYRAYQNAKRDKKEEIREKYETRIAGEVRAAVEAEKYAFATRLRDLKEYYGLNVTDIQDHVLRTRNWKVWEDIRDYADIQPEQIIREKTRTIAKERAEAEARTHEFKDGVLYWYKWNDGTTMESPFIFTDYNTETGEVYRPDILDAPARDYGVKELSKHISEAVTKEYAIGRIDSRTTFYEQYQAGTLSLAEYEEKMQHGENVNADWEDYN